MSASTKELMTAVRTLLDAPALNMDDMGHFDLLAIIEARKLAGLPVLSDPQHFAGDGCADEDTDCGACGADIRVNGEGANFPWHKADEDCRAIREPQ